MSDKQGYCGELQKYVRTKDFCQSCRENMAETKATVKLDAETISSWSHDMEGHAKKCVDRNCELANKTTQQFFEVATSCMDDHHFKEEEIGSVGELSTVCSHIVLKYLYSARIGRPGILWSVDKLARAVTKWTKACDKLLARLISYIHHTCKYRQYCYVEAPAQQCILGLFQVSDFAGDIEDCVDMECTMTGTPVTPNPKCLVSGPCWNLYLMYQLSEPLSPYCCHDVPCEQQWTQCILVC